MNKLMFVAIALCISLIGYSGETKINQEGKYHYQYVEGDPLQARIYILENGLTVYLSVNKQEPRVQTYIAVRAGSKT